MVMIEFRRNKPSVDWTLQNGSYQAVTNGQMGDFGYKSSMTLVPQGAQNHISRQVGRQFIGLLMTNATLHLNNFSMKYGDVSCDEIPSTLAPKHCIVIDSCNYDKHGTFIPSVTSFGLKQEFEALFIHKQFLLTLFNFSEIFYKSKHSLNVDLQVLLRFDVYDLHQAPHPQQECFITKRIATSCRSSRVCPTQRTLLRWQAQELEERAGGPVRRRYKGVRWRPQRKHPWVAEIKLPKKRKMWIGDFDTPEAAARAYDSAALAHGKAEAALNFGSSSLHNYNVVCFASQNFTSHISGTISAFTKRTSSPRPEYKGVHDSWYSVNDSPDFIPLDKLMLEGDQESPFFDTKWGDRSKILPGTKCANNVCSTSNMGPKDSSFGTA